MPPVVLFNKQWRVGSDDFVFSSILELLIRLGGLGALTFVLGLHINELTDLECMGKEYQYTTGYLIMAIILQVLTSVCLICLCKQSARGKIFDKTVPHPRRFVSLLLYVNILLTLVEFILTCVGTYFAVKDLTRCLADNKVRTVIIIIITVICITFVLLFIKMVIAITSFKPFGSASEDERSLLVQREELQERETAVTYRGLRCLMPWYKDESTIEAFKEISQLLSRIFHDSQLVPSDIGAGLILLHYKHNHERSNISRQEEQDQTKRLTDEELIDLKYYYKYSLAAYGCWWYVMDNPFHLCSLGAYITCCPCLPCMHPEDELVNGDGCCSCNLAAAKAILGNNDESFIVFDNRNRIQEVPFFMAVDDEKKSIIISIRGTISISDMFTDLRGEPGYLCDCLPEAVIGLDPTFKAHKGMVAAASYVFRKLHGIDRSNDQDRSARVNVMSMSLAEFQDYQLVVTGHSLGAGTAAILTFLLRNQYPDRDVKCFAYSPPGGLFNGAAATESEKFTLSLVVGDDVIPRTSLPNIARLSCEIREVLEQCELPKYKLLSHGLVAFCCCVKSNTIKEEMHRMFPETPQRPERGMHSSQPDLILLHSPSNTPSTSSSKLELSEVSSPTEMTKLSSAVQTNGRDTSNNTIVVNATYSEPMYLPGRILHIELNEDGDCNASTKDRNHFSSILVSPRMTMDHLPNYIKRVLDKLPS